MISNQFPDTDAQTLRKFTLGRLKLQSENGAKMETLKNIKQLSNTFKMCFTHGDRKHLQLF